jgi:hypothetical protein
VKVLSCGKDHAREEDDLKSIRKYHLYNGIYFNMDVPSRAEQCTILLRLSVSVVFCFHNKAAMYVKPSKHPAD